MACASGLDTSPEREREGGTKMMKRVPGVLVTAACAFALAGCTAKQAVPPPSGTLGENVQTVTATVEKIDLANRMVTLRGPKGNTVTVKVDASKSVGRKSFSDQSFSTSYGRWRIPRACRCAPCSWRAICES